MCIEIRSLLTHCEHYIVILLVYCRDPLLPFSIPCPPWQRQIVFADDPTVGWCQSCVESPRLGHVTMSGNREADSIEGVVHELAAETLGTGAVVTGSEGRMANGVFPGNSDYEDGDTTSGAQGGTQLHV
jgi:hypothetical protein